MNKAITKSIIIHLLCLSKNILFSRSHEYVDDFFNVDGEGGVDSSPSTNTGEPSLSPILSPMSSPMSSPASSPTSLQTPLPTLKSPNISQLPTPTSEQKEDPIKACVVSSSGFYGDEDATNLRSEYVKYHYQVEYKQNADIADILTDLEKSISNLILQSTSIFGECSSLSTRKHIRSRENRHLEETIVGLSSNPKDIVTSKPCPNQTIYDYSNCKVVIGILTLFYKDNMIRRLGTEDTITQVIKEHMGNDSLSLSNDKIIQLEYIDFSDFVAIQDRDVTSSVTGDENSVSNPNYFAYVLYAACGSIFVVGLIAIKLYKVNNNNDNDGEMISPRQSSIDVFDDDSSNFISSSFQESDISFIKRWTS